MQRDADGSFAHFEPLCGFPDAVTEQRYGSEKVPLSRSEPPHNYCDVVRKKIRAVFDRQFMDYSIDGHVATPGAPALCVDKLVPFNRRNPRTNRTFLVPEASVDMDCKQNFLNNVIRFVWRQTDLPCPPACLCS